MFCIKQMPITKVDMEKQSNKMKLLDLLQKFMLKKELVDARHASRKAPIFVGGGVAHGPKGELAYKKRKLNKSEKKLSIASLISEKIQR